MLGLGVFLLCALSACSHSPQTKVSPIVASASAASSCDAVRFSFNDEQVLGKTSSFVVTGRDINQDIAEESERLRRSYCQKVQKLRSDALDNRIKIQVIETNAKKEGLSLEQWLEKKQAEAPLPTPEEVLSFYQSEVPNGEPSFEEVQDEVKTYLIQSTKQKFLIAEIERLMSNAEVVKTMPDISPKPVDLHTPTHAPVIGDKETPVEITVFSDFQCPYCAKIAPILNAVVQEKKTSVHLVFRHFPLSFHANAFDAAVFSQCANEQGKFLEFHDKLFVEGVSLERSSLWLMADALELDRDRMKNCVSDKKTETIIEADLQAARNLGVQGTPSIFINGKEYQGERNIASLIEATEKALERSARDGD